MTEFIVGPMLSLAEVQALLMKRGKEDGDPRRPLLVFVPNKPPNKDKPMDVTSTDHRCGLSCVVCVHV